MGSCCSSNVKVTPQTLETKTNIKKHEKKSNKEKVKDLIYFLEAPNESGNLQLKEFNRKDVETQSMLSTTTGTSMVFPNPAEIEVLTHTPPKAATYVNIEDTFWSAKRRLVPDYSVMEKIDQHVLKASPDLKNSASKLVEYLIKPCKNDVDKARAIVRWMGENVQYDTNFLKTGVRGDQSVEGVLKSGRAVCDGYGTVFRHLGELAGLECQKISGQAKGAGYYPGCFDPARLSAGPGAHAWNAVKLYGEWYLSDATWAAGSVDSKSDTDFVKKWNEVYFLSDPVYFVLEHIPLDGNMILPDEQHMPEPISDPQVWADLALMTPQAGVFGVRPITHQNGVIKSSSGEVTIKYACSFPLTQFVNISRQEKRGNQTVTVTGPKIDEMVALHCVDERGIIIGRFTEPGTYDIVLSGYITNGHPALKVSNQLLTYRIIVSKPSKSTPLPAGLDGKWGIQQKFINAGYRVLYPKDAMIRTSSGLAIVKIKLPTDGQLPNMHKLYFADGKKKAEMNEFVIAGQRGNVATYYIQCPQPGEYKLEVYAKYENKEIGFSVGAAVLIQCTKSIANPFKLDTNNCFMGVYEEFHKLGLFISAKGTILKAKDAEARLRIKKTKPVKFLKKLHLITSSQCTIEDAIDTKEIDGVVTFTAKLPQLGFYVLSLYATPESNAGSYPMVGRFGISNGSHI